MSTGLRPTISVDRSALNDELTEMLSGFGWTAETEDDFRELNELTHAIADWLEDLIEKRKH